MPLLNYTTTIPAAKTIGEIQELLSEHGADRIAVSYANRKPVGLSFALVTAVGPRVFELPVDVEAVFALLDRQKTSRSKTEVTREQAEKVGWRILKDWVAAQLALTETQMVTIDQVMLPYMITDSGATVYQAFRDRVLELTQ